MGALGPCQPCRDTGARAMRFKVVSTVARAWIRKSGTQFTLRHVHGLWLQGRMGAAGARTQSGYCVATEDPAAARHAAGKQFANPRTDRGRSVTQHR